MQETPAATELRRAHDMPFGAEVLSSGGVRFRLWAPGARTVALSLGAGRPRQIAMTALDGGCFEVEVAEAGPGTRYAFLVDEQQCVPDPASRFQPDDVHAASEVIDPRAHSWRDGDWSGRPWEEAVLYELHVGTFSPRGDFDGVAQRLDHLLDLGVTAIELMPLADFPGRRNWGYDGVYPFAPDASLGRPDRLKALVEAAHARGLMMFLDVVYNHFGPEGNYLHVYAPAMFTGRHHTPWGKAINYDGPGRETVRSFFIHNALFWIEEYGFDGLRLDAVHAIADDSEPDILTELADTVRSLVGTERRIHLMLENDRNESRYLDRTPDSNVQHFVAQWNDDAHHALHVLITGETAGYYADFADDPAACLGRALAEGFAYQGQPSGHRGGAPRGEPSAHLPPVAFVDFLQNHDQVGNRPLGDRIDVQASAEAVEAALVVLLLSPHPPLLFMGQEWAASTPFPFFCDFGADLAEAVCEGRRREFAQFPEFRDAEARERIPDPNDPRTFARAVLDWDEPTRPTHRARMALVGRLLDLRRSEIVPRLPGAPGGAASWQRWDTRALGVTWRMGDGALLALAANLGPHAAPCPQPFLGERLIYAHNMDSAVEALDMLPPWSVRWGLSPDTSDGHGR